MLAALTDASIESLHDSSCMTGCNRRDLTPSLDSPESCVNPVSCMTLAVSIIKTFTVSYASSDWLLPVSLPSPDGVGSKTSMASLDVVDAVSFGALLTGLFIFEYMKGFLGLSGTSTWMCLIGCLGELRLIIL